MKTNPLIVFVLLIFIIGSTLGFTIGFYAGVNQTIDIGLKFLEANDIMLDIDEQSLKNGVLNYRNQINRCFENAPVLND